MKKYKKSPMWYMGSKFRLLPTIEPMFPKNINTFYDVFGGSGVVTINVEAKVKKYNEFNPFIKSMLECLLSTEKQEIISHVEKRINEFGLISGVGGKGKATYKHLTEEEFIEVEKRSKDNYLSFRSFVNEGSREDFLDYFTLSCFSHCHNMRFNKSGGFNMPIGNDGSPSSIKNKLEETNVEENIEFYNLDFEKFIKVEEMNEDDFVYLDPPYFNSTAVYNENRLTGWEIEDDFRLFKLLEQLNEKGIKWGLSNVFEIKGKTNEHLIKWCEENKWNVEFLNFEYSALGKGNSKNKEVYITNY